MRILLPLFFILTILTSSAWGQTYFYSTGTNSSPTTLSNWNSMRDGSGTAPANFTANNQVFVIQDGHTISRTTGGWTISGTNSQLLVEGGGTYTSTSTTGATMTINLSGTATKLAVWNQTSGYAVTNITGNQYSKINLFSPANFRFDKTYPGTVHVRGNTPGTMFGSTTGLNVAGDFIIGTNTTFIAANTTNNVSHQIGGSMIIRGGTYTQVGSTGIPTFQIGNSLVYESGTLENGAGTALTNYTVGTAGGQDTVALAGIALNGFIQVATGANVLLKDHVQLSGGTFTIGSNARLTLNNKELSGTSNLVVGSGATLVTTHANGFKSGSNGNFKHTGTTSFSGSTNLVYTGGGALSTGLVNFAVPQIGKLMTTGNSTTVALDANITVGDSLFIASGAEFTYNGRSMTLSGTIRNDGSLLGSATSDLVIDGSGSVTGLTLPTTLNSFTLDRPGYELNSGSLTCTGAYQVLDGTHRLTTGTLTLNGPISVSGNVEFSLSANLIIGGTGTITGQLTTDTINNLTYGRTGQTFGLSSVLYIAGTLTTTAGVLSAVGDSLILAGAVSLVANSLLTDSTTSVTLAGSGAVSGLSSLTQVKHLTLNRSGHTLTQSADLTVYGRYQLTTGGHDLTARSVTFKGRVVFTTLPTVTTTTSLHFLGSGSMAGIPSTAINHLTLNRADTLVLSQNLTVNGSLSFGTGSGALNISGRTIDLKGAVVGSPRFIVNNSTQMTISGTGSVAPIQLSTTIGSVTVTRPNTTVKPGNNWTIASYLEVVASSALNINNRSLTVNGTTLVNGSLVSNNNSNLTIGGFGSLSIADLDTIGNLTLTRSSTALSLSKNLVIYGTYTSNANSMLNVQANEIYFYGSIANSGTINYLTTSSLFILGSGSVTGIVLPATINNLTLSRTVSYTAPTVLTVNGTLTIGTGATLNASSKTLTLEGPVSVQGTLTTTSANVTISGTGSMSGNLSFGTVATFSFSRTGQPLTLNGNMTCSGAFSMATGTNMVLNGKSLTLNGNVDMSGTIKGNYSSSISIMNTGSFSWTGTVDSLYTLSIIRTNINHTMAANLAISNSLTIGIDSRVTVGPYWLTLEGTIPSLPNITFDSTSSFTLKGNGSTINFPNITRINNLIVYRNNYTVSPANNFEAFGRVEVSSLGRLNLSGKSAIFRGDVDIATGRLTTNSTTNITFKGTGSVAGFASIFQLGSLTLDRPGINYTLASTQNINGNLLINTGSTLSIQTGSLIMYGNIEINGEIVTTSQSSIGLEGSGTIIGDKLFRLTTLKNFGHKRTNYVWQHLVDVTFHGNVYVAINCPIRFDDVSVTLLGEYVSNSGLGLNTGTSLHLLGSGTLLGIPNISTINNLTNTRAGFTLQSLGTVATVNGSFYLGANAGFNVSNRTLLLNGPITFEQGAILTTSNSTSINIEGSGTFTGSLPTTALGNLRLKRSGLNLTLSSDLSISQTCELDANNTLDFKGYTLTLGGAIDNEGTLTTDSTGSLTVSGTGGVVGGLQASSINNISLQRTNMVLKQMNNIMVKGAITLTNNATYDLDDVSLTAKGNITVTSGSLRTNSATSFYIVGNGTTATLGDVDELYDFMIARSSTATTTLGNNLAVGNQFSIAANNQLNMTGRTLTMNGPVNIIGLLNTDSTSGLIINGSGSFSGALTATKLAQFILNRSGATITQNQQLQINQIFRVINGTYDFRGRSLVLLGEIDLAGTLVADSTSSLTIGGSGYLAGLPTFTSLNNFTLTRAVGFSQGADLKIKGSFTLGASSTFNIFGRKLTLEGPISLNGDVNTNNNTDLVINGSGAISGNLSADVIKSLQIDRSGQTLGINSNLTVEGPLSVTAGSSLSLKNQTLNLLGDITGGGQLRGNKNAYLFIQNAGLLSTDLIIDTVKTLFMNRSGALLKLNRAFYSDYELNIQSGNELDARGQSLTINGVLSNDGTIRTNGATSLYLTGTGYVTNPPAFDSINHFTVTKSGLNYTPATSQFVISGAMVLGENAGLNLQNKTMTLNGPVSLLGTLNTNEETQVVIGGSGSVDSLKIDYLKRFTLNRASSQVNLKGNMLVVDQLNVTQGILNTGQYQITLPPSATITGENASGYVKGYLKAQSRNVGNGSSDFSGLGFSVASGAQALGNVEVIRKTGLVGIGTRNGNQGIQATYEVNIDGDQPVSGRQITFGWLTSLNNNNDFSGNRADIWTRPDPANPWTLLANDATITNQGDWKSVTVTTYHFSDFTATDDNNTLPVELVSFSAVRNGASVRIDWATSQEYNNKGFSLERSQEGKVYEPVAFVAGRGTTSQSTTYQYSDKQAQAAYYRLVQVDFDGKETVQPAVYVNASQSRGYTLLQNQTAGTVELNGLANGDQVSVYDAGGRLVISQVAEQDSLQFTTSHWPAGTYYIKVSGQFAQSDHKLYIR